MDVSIFEIQKMFEDEFSSDFGKVIKSLKEKLNQNKEKNQYKYLYETDYLFL